MTNVSIKSNISDIIEVPVMFNYMSSVKFTESERKCLELQSPEEVSKSKYDLPIAFHPKEYEQWLRSKNSKLRSRRNVQVLFAGSRHLNFEKYVLSQKTSIMYLCEGQRPNRKSRFEFLKPGVLTAALDQRPKFSALRHMAIQLLRNDTLLKLKIIGDNEQCPSTRDIPHRLFSWSAEDYYQRRDVENTVWLEVYERDYKDFLEIMKFKFDLQELCHYLDIILCGALSENTDFSFECEVVEPLEDASDLLSIFERLKSELSENRQYVEELRSELEISDSIATAAEEKARMSLIRQSADAAVLYPIQYRYQKAWYDAQADQVEIKQDMELKKLNDEVFSWVYKISQESGTIQNALNIFYNKIEFYKNKNTEFLTKFESEYDDLDNAINYKRLSMSKLETQRKYCEDQIDVMREKVAEYRIKKKLEEEEKLRLARETQQANLLKQVKCEERRMKKETKKSPAKSKNIRKK